MNGARHPEEKRVEGGQRSAWLGLTEKEQKKPSQRSQGPSAPRGDTDTFPWGAWPRDAAVTRTSMQAGKALRSQGHQYARVM